ncbi:MAG: hypothetical protein V3T23_01960, partial [Nitrososphaerales archaeon]
MRLEGLEISNFLIFGEDQELTLPAIDDLMLLIRGERDGTGTENSNGSGKSSLMEAVYWAVTGKTVRGGTTKQVPRFGTKQCHVLARFLQRGGKPYYIKRLWSPNNKIVTVLDSEGEHHFHTAEEGTKRIASDLGLFHTDLLALTTFFGRRFPAFSRLGPSEKAQIIDILASAEKWDERRAEAGRLAKTINGDLRMRESNLAVGIQNKKETEEELNDLLEVIKSLNAAYDDYVSDLQGQVAAVSYELGEAEIAQNKENCIQKNIRDNIESTERQVRDLKTDKIQLKGEITAAHGRLSETNRRGELLVKEQRRLEVAKQAGVCPKCQRDWKEGNHQLETEIQEIWKTLHSMDGDKDGHVNEIRSLESLMTELDEAIEEFQASVLEPREQANRALVESKNYGLKAQDARSKKQRLEVQLAKIEERTDIRRKEGQATALEDQIKKLQQNISTLSTDIAELRSEAIVWRYWEQGFKVIRFKVLEATVELLQRTLTSVAIGALGLDADEIKVSMFKDGTKAKRAEVTITVRRGEHEIPLGMLSDGESQRMDLACFIALGALVKQITGMDLGFRVFDEPLTNLDADGKYKAFHLIRGIPEAQKFV